MTRVEQPALGLSELSGEQEILTLLKITAPPALSRVLTLSHTWFHVVLGTTPKGEGYYTHFTEEEAEAQREQVTCLKSHSRSAEELRFKPRSL